MPASTPESILAEVKRAKEAKSAARDSMTLDTKPGWTARLETPPMVVADRQTWRIKVGDVCWDAAWSEMLGAWEMKALKMDSVDDTGATQQPKGLAC
jgi:hypothetical protein